jgi:PAS domain S-box-containing protein
MPMTPPMEEDGSRPGAGPRTIAGVAACMLLSFAAMGAIAYFVDGASRKNALALLYEHADAQLRDILHDLEEVALSEAAPRPLNDVKSGLSQFQALRHRSEELTAETGEVWPALDSALEALIQKRHKVAVGDNAMVELGRATSIVEKVQVGLGQRAREKRESAIAADKGIGLVIVMAGFLIVLGTAGVFVILNRASRKVLAAVRASEWQLRNITDAVPALIAYVDAGRRFRFHNKGYEETLGLQPAQIRGHTVREVFGDEVYASMQPRIDEVLAGAPVRFEHAQKVATGESRDYAVHFFPRHRGDLDGEPVIGFYSLLTDITEMKRIDRMKTEFVSTVSHELRTPLTSIRGSLGLIAGGVAGKVPAAVGNLVDIAKSNCERLIRLINDLLDTEKIESGQMALDLRVVDLQPLLTQTVAANEGFARQHHVRLALRATPGQASVRVDTDRLIQVVTNLLSNAIKFSPPQGIVELVLSSAADRVRIEVRDRGHSGGIPHAHIPEVLPSRFLRLAPEKRHRTGADDLQGHRGASRRHHRFRQRDGGGNDLLFRAATVARGAFDCHRGRGAPGGASLHPGVRGRSGHRPADRHDARSGRLRRR